MMEEENESHKKWEFWTIPLSLLNVHLYITKQECERMRKKIAFKLHVFSLFWINVKYDESSDEARWIVNLARILLDKSGMPIKCTWKVNSICSLCLNHARKLWVCLSYWRMSIENRTNLEKFTTTSSSSSSSSYHHRRHGCRHCCCRCCYQSTLWCSCV